MKLAGKVALVTGGNSGIGLATAKLLSQEGAKVVIAGRDHGTLHASASAIGGDVLALQTDVADLEQLDQLYQAIAEKLGKIDVLFANAGVGRFTSLEKVQISGSRLPRTQNLVSFKPSAAFGLLCRCSTLQRF